MDENRKWERELLEKLAGAALVEQRRARQWKIFFRLIWLVLLVIVLSNLFILKGEDTASTFVGESKHTAVLRLEGIIDSEHDSADKLTQGLNDAYNDKRTRGIIIHANSPGGSPVLSGVVYDEIRRLKKRYPSIPVHIVVSEICASGCYYIAAAADKIFVDKASIIGSIGVISDGFGFTGLMQKLGIDRRLQTAGEYKALGDPFSPINPKQEILRQQLLDDIHRQFIEAVKNGRGTRLKITPDTFSGLIWLGEKSVPLGLADGYGTVSSIARDVIKAEKTVDFTPEDDTASRLIRHLGLEFKNSVKSLLTPFIF